jgi:hypothetical protein
MDTEDDDPGVFPESEIHNLELLSVGQNEFNVSSRYTFVHAIGRGSYGVVA